jgi:hypothetical protein
MKSTANYNLSKPESTDLFEDVLPGMMSDNMDIIDEALYIADLCGKIEISVTTETNAVHAPIHGGRRNIIGAVTTLRHVYNGASLEGFEPPNVQVYTVLYQGSLCALLKCPSGNIPIGTYTIDWKATEVS